MNSDGHEISRCETHVCEGGFGQDHCRGTTADADDFRGSGGGGGVVVRVGGAVVWGGGGGGGVVVPGGGRGVVVPGGGVSDLRIPRVPG